MRRPVPGCRFGYGRGFPSKSSQMGLTKRGLWLQKMTWQGSRVFTERRRCKTARPAASSSASPGSCGISVEPGAEQNCTRAALHTRPHADTDYFVGRRTTHHACAPPRGHCYVGIVESFLSAPAQFGCVLKGRGSYGAKCCGAGRQASPVLLQLFLKGGGGLNLTLPSQGWWEPS